MRKFVLLLSLPVVLNACFLFRDFKKKEFTFTDNNRSQAFSLLVPKGYVKETVQDTAGMRLHTYQYSGGSVLYAAYLQDTTVALQSFNKALHQPQPFPSGGLVYKGQDENERFYREIRQGNFRFGYRGVPAANETYFDSATNYAAWRKQ